MIWIVPPTNPTYCFLLWLETSFNPGMPPFLRKKIFLAPMDLDFKITSYLRSKKTPRPPTRRPVFSSLLRHVIYSSLLDS